MRRPGVLARPDARPFSILESVRDHRRYLGYSWFALPEALAALQDSDYIIHAGDIGDPLILDKLAAIAPLTAVRGNVDHGAWAKKIPATNVLEIGKTSIYVLHNLQELDLKPEAAKFVVVVYGHSHVPKQELKNGVLYFNPGSAGPRRFKLPVSVGRLRLTNGKVESEVVEVLT